MKNIKVNKINAPLRELYNYWLLFLKPFHKLTGKEIELLASFMYYEHILLRHMEGESLTKMLFSVKVKTKIREELGGMNKIVMNNLLYILRKKGVLSKENEINPAVKPPMDGNAFSLIFNFEPDGSDKKGKD